MQKNAWEKITPTQNNEFKNTLKPAYILSLYLIKKKKHQLQLYSGTKGFFRLLSEYIGKYIVSLTFFIKILVPCNL